MRLFTSSKRRAEQAVQAELAHAQSNANRLHLFLASVSAGLDSEGYRYAQRAIGLLVAIAGWPTLTSFIYAIGQTEQEFVGITSEEEGKRQGAALDYATAQSAIGYLMKAYAGPLTLETVQDMRTIASVLLVWWAISDLAEPEHPVVRLMQQFGGHPFKPNNVQEMSQRLNEIRTWITPQAQEVWKQAEREMSIYANGLRP